MSCRTKTTRSAGLSSCSTTSRTPSSKVTRSAGSVRAARSGGAANSIAAASWERSRRECADRIWSRLRRQVPPRVTFRFWPPSFPVRSRRTPLEEIHVPHTESHHGRRTRGLAPVAGGHGPVLADRPAAQPARADGPRAGGPGGLRVAQEDDGHARHLGPAGPYRAHARRRDG